MAPSQDEFAGGESAERAAVARTTASLLSAVNAADLAGVVAVWSDDGVLMPPHHPSVRGRPEIERYFSELFERTRFTFSFTATTLHISGGTAFERIEYSVSARPSQGGAEARDVGKGLHVYRREPNGLWKLALDIWNSDTPVRS
jgi:ketosteroid isomerase-like protein